MTVKTRKKVPITRHPAFPVTVALWFAALFGLGSLLLRADLLEALVTAIRLDRVIPAAAPPLGFTARTLVAVVLSGLGGLIGFALARLVGSGTDSRRAGAPAVQRGKAPAKSPATTPEQAGATERPPSDDNDDLARLEAARESNPTRRRGLNAQLVVDPFATPPEATMPEPAILNLGELTAIEPISPSRAMADPVPALADEPDQTPDQTVAPIPAEGAMLAAAAPTSHPFEVIAPADSVPVTPAIRIAPEPAQAAASAPADAPVVPPSPVLALKPRQGTAAEVLREAPLDTLGVVELVERLALAVAARRARESAADAAAAADAPAAEPVPALGDAPAERAILVPSQANGHSRPFDMPARTPEPTLPGPALSGTVDWLSDAERALGAAPNRAEVLPPLTGTPSEAAWDDADWDEEDQAEDGHSRGLDEGGWALPDLDDEADDDVADVAEEPAAASDRPDASATEAPSGEPGFSSLLAMKPTARPAPQEPGEFASADRAATAASSEATEEALRKALATLQRMSGAA